MPDLEKNNLDYASFDAKSGLGKMPEESSEKSSQKGSQKTTQKSTQNILDILKKYSGKNSHDI